LKHEVIPSAFGVGEGGLLLHARLSSRFGVWLVWAYFVVLAGSKYGVRQTRGKFGLGAKMVHGLEFAHHLPARCTIAGISVFLWFARASMTVAGADLVSEIHGFAH
jgi:hypothetical protein